MEALAQRFVGAVLRRETRPRQYANRDVKLPQERRTLVVLLRTEERPEQPFESRNRMSQRNQINHF
jgi:hypothetical protein